MRGRNDDMFRVQLSISLENEKAAPNEFRIPNEPDYPILLNMYGIKLVLD